MKKNVCTILVVLIMLLLTSCGAEKQNEHTRKPDDTAMLIRAHIERNLDYEITDLRVVAEESGYHIVITVKGSPLLLQSLCYDSIHCLEAYAEEKGVAISKINPVIQLSDEQWYGWSTEGTLYSDSALLAENVSVDNITETLTKKSNDVAYIVKSQKRAAVMEKYGDFLNAIQGEWKRKYPDGGAIINGASISFISYWILIKEPKVQNIHTFFFDMDDDENIVIVNDYGQLSYKIDVNEDGELLIVDAYGDDVEIYRKISDNTTLPEIVVEPTIGMSEDEVIRSTWGYPKRKNTTTTAFGVSEQWVYDKGYIYFADGHVEAIQTH